MTLGVVLPLILILGLFTAIDHRRHRAEVWNQLSVLASYSGRIIEANLRHEMVEMDSEGVQGLLDTVAESGIFRVVYLLDSSGQVAVAAGNGEKGTQLDNTTPDCQVCHRLEPEARPQSVIVTADTGERVFRTMIPIKNGPKCGVCHDPNQDVLGLVLADIPTAPVERPVTADLRKKLLWWAGTILATVIVVNFAMGRLVMNRLARMAAALANFGRGQRDLRLNADSRDEIGHVAHAFNRMGRDIQSEETRNLELTAEVRRHADRQRELLKRLITAQEEERRRVAHDLHDDLGQDLAGLALNLESVQQVWDDPPEQVRSRLLQARTQVAEMTERAYDMILSLRPSALDDLGLVPALRSHAERVLDPAGIQLDLETRDLTHRPPPEFETALFRTLQEALNNVVRHSGAKRVRVSLAVHDGAFQGEVADDGCGFDPETVPLDGSGPRGLGMLSMQERAALCDGTLEIRSSPGAGTLVRIRIPVDEANDG